MSRGPPISSHARTDNLTLEYVSTNGRTTIVRRGPVFNVSRPADPASGFAGDDLCVRFEPVPD